MAPTSLEAALAELRPLFGNRLTLAQAFRDQHCETSTWLPSQPPDAVVFAESAADVQAVVRACGRHRVPIIPFGTGTSLEGQVNAPSGGIALDLGRMNRILQVNAEDLDCVVEAGVTRLQLNDHIRDLGLFFPIDPGADASLGGMASTRASGTNAVRYGTMRENVVAMSVVLPDGELIRTGSRARKSAAGYDVTRLMVGAASTLGVIVDLTIRLHGIPETIAAGVCRFPTIADACATTSQCIQYGLPIARVELLDSMMIRMCNTYGKLGLPEAPTLFVEFHGTPSGVAEQTKLFREIAAGNGSADFVWAADAAERAALWKARHTVSSACRAWRPGARFLGTDACVPISRLAECVTETMADLERLGLVGAATGHVGDGNFHVAVMVDMDNPDEVTNAKAFSDALAFRAIAMDGTCTGEHGIGQGKMRFLVQEAGASLSVMRAVKQALDPTNIMNPGKIFEFTA